MTQSGITEVLLEVCFRSTSPWVVGSWPAEVCRDRMSSCVVSRKLPAIFFVQQEMFKLWHDGANTVVLCSYRMAKWYLITNNLLNLMPKPCQILVMCLPSTVFPKLCGGQPFLRAGQHSSLRSVHWSTGKQNLACAATIVVIKCASEVIFWKLPGHVCAEMIMVAY